MMTFSLKLRLVWLTSGSRASSSWLVIANELKFWLGSARYHNKPSRAEPSQPRTERTNELRVFHPALPNNNAHCSGPQYGPVRDDEVVSRRVLVSLCPEIPASGPRVDAPNCACIAALERTSNAWTIWRPWNGRKCCQATLQRLNENLILRCCCQKCEGANIYRNPLGLYRYKKVVKFTLM
jgi:hypothetical protein